MEILNPRPRRRVLPPGMAAVLLLVAGQRLVADEARNPVFAARAQAEFQRAQTQFQLHTNDPIAGWQLGRACYDLNDFLTNNAGRAERADQGIAACRQALVRDSNSAPAHYYLAIELGLLADTKRNLAAFKLVREMEHEFKTAYDRDEHFDYAGAARCLGLLYRDAPGWPVSIGSRHRAREWLEHAVKLSPEYPENQLNLAESSWQWKERETARRALEALDKLWPAARTNFTGEAWERSWADWSARRDALREKISETSAPGRPSRNSQN